MKASRMFLVILIVAAAFTAAVNIFSDSRAEVEIKEIAVVEYADCVVIDGTVYDGTRQTINPDGSMQTVSQKGVGVTAYVGEKNISKLRVGQSAVISGSGFGDKTYNATVKKIGSSAEKISVGGIKVAAVEVVLVIDNPDDALKSGFSAKAKIFTEDKSDVVIVPYSSVLFKDGREYVYVYNNDTATLTPVKTGRELSDGYEIISGVKSGDKIVVTPHKIKDESCKVTVISEVL